MPEDFWEGDAKSISDSSKLSTDFFQRVLEDLEILAVEDSTLQTYMVSWHALNDFWTQLDTKPETWEDQISLFTAYMIMKRFQPSTIRSYISGIKYILNLIDIKVDTNSFKFSALVKAARYKNKKLRLRLPIKLRLLNRILDEVKKIPRVRDQPYLIALYRAMFVSAYYGLMRVGEITNSKHVVKSRDAHVARNKTKVQFRLWTAKNLKRGQWPDDIKIDGLHDCRRCFPTMVKSAGRSKNSESYCPVCIIKKYNALRERTQGCKQFFIFRSGIAVGAHNFRTVLKEALKRIGVDNSVYNCHSFRHGRCCDLRRLGYSILDLKLVGRWRSNAVYNYMNE